MNSDKPRSADQPYSLDSRTGRLLGSMACNDLPLRFISKRTWPRCSSTGHNMCALSSRFINGDTPSVHPLFWLPGHARAASCRCRLQRLSLATPHWKLHLLYAVYSPAVFRASSLQPMVSVYCRAGHQTPAGVSQNWLMFASFPAGCFLSFNSRDLT
jgi:hypothetical protein